MIVLTNENTTKGNIKGTESLPQISKSLSDSSYNLKKIRHSLKDLCFHSPSPQILANLIELFKKELKTQTDCFILLCHNLITHAPYANTIPQTGDFIITLAKTITESSKKPQKSLDDIFRVFFSLCFYSPSFHSLLFDTVGKILTMSLDFLNKKKKKSIIGGSHKSPYPDLITQCLVYLNELPDFDNYAVLLLSREDVVTGLINIFKNFHSESKYIYTFLGRLSKQIKNGKVNFKIPQQILDNIVPDDDFIANPFVCEYMIYNPEKFKSQIISVLEKSSSQSEIERKIASSEKKIANSNSAPEEQEDSDKTRISSINLMQLRIVEIEDNIPEMILSSIKSQVESNPSALLPLMRALQKIPRGQISDHNLESSLYKRVQSSNLSVAFISFMCLCFVSDEIDWISTFFVDTMSKLTYSARCSISLVSMKSWIYALDHPDSNKFFVIELFEKTLNNFGNCLNQTMFSKFLQKVIDSGCADDFMMIFINSLDKLPSIESVIFIFFGAAMLKKHADQQTFQEFLDVAQGYIANAGPAMLSFYNMTVHKAAGQ